MAYIRNIHSPIRAQVQIIVPKNFLSTDRLKKNKSRFMNEIKNDVVDFWITTAGLKLNKTRDAYVNNLHVKSTTEKNLVFELVGPAVAIEKGYKPFDMKVGFSKSSKLKEGKMKIPRDKRAEFTGKIGGAPKLIIPIDPQNGIFRTFSMNQLGSNMWLHGGYGGIHIMQDVQKQLKESIIPKRVGKYIRDSFAK